MDVLAVLLLVLELTDKPELYDLRFMSGVVRDEEGVDVFLGSIDGDRDDGRPASTSSG